jgi:hypothetical protein
MSKIIQLIVTSGLLDEIRAAAKQHKISVAHRIVQVEQREQAKTRDYQSTRCACGALESAEQEFADSVIQQHFEEDR